MKNYQYEKRPKAVKLRDSVWEQFALPFFIEHFSIVHDTEE